MTAHAGDKSWTKKRFACVDSFSELCKETELAELAVSAEKTYRKKENTIWASIRECVEMIKNNPFSVEEFLPLAIFAVLEKVSQNCHQIKKQLSF